MIERSNYFFAQVRKPNSLCVGVFMSTFVPVDSERMHYVAIESYDERYLNKYYYNETWYERVWNEYDENRNPVESAGYTDVPWTPEGE